MKRGSSILSEKRQFTGTCKEEAARLTSPSSLRYGAMVWFWSDIVALFARAFKKSAISRLREEPSGCLKLVRDSHFCIRKASCMVMLDATTFWWISTITSSSVILLDRNAKEKQHGFAMK